MTNLEKWKNKFAEAKNGFDVLCAHNLMESEIDKWCHKQDGEHNCEKCYCNECMAEWGNSEVEEDDTKREDTEHDTK